MRRTVRQGTVLATALLAVTGALAVPAAASSPVAPSGGLRPARAASSLPTAGPTERLCGPASPGVATCFAERRIGAGVTPADSLPQGYGPADLHSAYSLPATGGAGVTVAVDDAFGYPTAATDLAHYRAQFGLPALVPGQFTVVNQDGKASPLPAYDSGWAGETALDLDMVTATCPSCNILLVEGDTASTDDLATAAQTAVRLGAKYVSNSYGSPDDSGANGDAGYSAPSVSFFASTGDEGYTAGAAPEAPATIPGVTAVGGTSLQPSSTARGWTETAWSGAGHGDSCSSTYPEPSFQAATVTQCVGRAVADVSAVADPATGVAVYDSSPNGGGWTQVGGTSAATPIVTGIAALAGTPGLPTGDLYANAADFHDVTSGRTGACGTVLCTAGPGWDAPTGIGTPAGTGGFTLPGTSPTSCGGTPASTDESTSTSAGQYVPVTPVRVLDTRDNTTTPTLGTGGVATVDLGQYLPDGTASAVVVNVTATNPTAAGFVTVWPAGSDRPTASTLNTAPGVTRANEATVALGPVTGSGTTPRGISLYNHTGNTDLVVDLMGYYTADGDQTAALTYHPQATPTRALDTRTGRGPLTASGDGSKVCVTVSQPAGDGTSLTGIGAVAVTLTAVAPTGPGYLKAWNGVDASEPFVSTLNFQPGQIVPNAAVVPVSCLDAACSAVTFAVANRISPSTQVVVDVVGVYASQADGGLVLQPQSPTRVVDTRIGLGFTTLGTDDAQQVAIPGAVAGGAVAANVTAVLPTAPTYLTAYGATKPPTSNLNPVPGDIVPAEVISPVDGNGALSVFNHNGSVDVVVDVEGVFVPPTS